MPERDEKQEALKKVEDATDSDPVNGEDLLQSEELKRQLREAKKRWSRFASATVNLRFFRAAD